MTHVTRWTLTASRKDGQHGWLVQSRSPRSPRLPVWFAHRADAVTLLRHLQAGLTLHAAFAAMHEADARQAPTP